MARTTWSQKMDKPPAPVVKPLDRRFAGHHPGELMLISTPRTIQARVRRLRPGTAITIAELRDRLASSADADFTCPLSTGIFLRIVAESALDDMRTGSSTDEITPFWRAIEPDSALASKLSCGPAFIARQRARESS
ncbi:MAG: hypothetical protein ACKN9D_00015 [Actinomycetales bacterium]